MCIFVSTPYAPEFSPSFALYLYFILQSHQTLESLEDFKRKLANEHTTVSAKLDQGQRARQELQDLKTKLVDDLEQSRKALQKKVEKVDAKLGATSKLKRNKEDQLEYLMESLEEARGNLEACIKSRSRLEEFSKKLDFESEEIEKKLETEMERSGKLRQDMADLEAQMESNKTSFKEEVHRLKGAIKAEEQIAAGLKEFGVLLNTGTEAFELSV